MIILCAEENESVIWINPRGRQLTRTEFVPLVFGRVEEWQELLAAADNPICVHVLRTKTQVLPLIELGISSYSGCGAFKHASARRRGRSPKAPHSKEPERGLGPIDITSLLFRRTTPSQRAGTGGVRSATVLELG